MKRLPALSCAGCHSRKLPGCAERWLLQSERRLRESLKEVSDNSKMCLWAFFWLICFFGGDQIATSQSSSLCLLSGPNDHVFVYFTDHGAPGILAFPNGEVGCLVFTAHSQNPWNCHFSSLCVISFYLFYFFYTSYLNFVKWEKENECRGKYLFIWINWLRFF